jgi:hypothetical protein
MNRINVVEDGYEDGPTLVGWFDLDRASAYEEATDWDGSNRVSLATGNYAEHEILYRTAGGRWVLHHYSQWRGQTPTYKFIRDSEARDWLLLCEHDEAVAKHFGEVAEESGPGRPEIGGAIHVRLGDDKAAVDTYAADQGITASEAVRRFVRQGLKQHD